MLTEWERAARHLATHVLHRLCSPEKPARYARAELVRHAMTVLSRPSRPRPEPAPALETAFGSDARPRFLPLDGPGSQRAGSRARAPAARTALERVGW